MFRTRQHIVNRANLFSPQKSDYSIVVIPSLLFDTIRESSYKRIKIADSKKNITDYMDISWNSHYLKRRQRCALMVLMFIVSRGSASCIFVLVMLERVLN